MKLTNVSQFEFVAKAGGKHVSIAPKETKDLDIDKDNPKLVAALHAGTLVVGAQAAKAVAEGKAPA